MVRPLAPLAIAAASAALLIAAFGFQHLGGLAPCELCVYQRWPHGAVIVFAALALAWPKPRALFLFLAGAAALTSAGIGVYHVGVEQGWFPATAACGASGGAATIEELRARIATAPTARCTDVAWSLAGISMAGYNALFSTLIAGVSWRFAAR